MARPPLGGYRSHSSSMGGMVTKEKTDCCPITDSERGIVVQQGKSPEVENFEGHTAESMGGQCDSGECEEVNSWLAELVP